MNMKPGLPQAGEPDLLRAIEWSLLLRSGHADDESLAAYRAWQGAHPRHREACARIDSALRSFRVLRERGVDGAVAGRSMQAASRRSALRGALAVAGVCTGGLGWQIADRQGLLADQHTGVAQRSQGELPGGGTLWLDARTAVDVDPASRTLTLHRGQMLVQAPAGAAAPLRARTPLATLEARDARFVVQARSDRPLMVTSLQGSVTVLRDADRLELPAGRHAEVAPGRPVRTADASGTEDLWTRGLVAMDDEPLGRLVEALQDYRHGLLEATATAAQVRVSGLFSLDDSERTLQLLVQTQPLRLRARTRYWVTIESA
jgi:transmembrane sensor